LIFVFDGIFITFVGGNYATITTIIPSFIFNREFERATE